MQHPAFAAASRAIVAVGGGYALVALAVSALATLLTRVGQAPSDAVVTAAMLGFPGYLCVLLWALACPGLRRLTAVLGLGCLVFGTLAWLGAKA